MITTNKTIFQLVILTVGHLTRQNSKLVALLCYQCKTKQSLPPFSYFSNLSFSSFSSPRRVAIAPNGTVFEKLQRVMSLFKLCSTMKDLYQIHGRIIRAGFEQDLFVMGKIVEFCAIGEGRDLDYALLVLDSVENPDGFLWNTMIRGFGKTNQPERAFELYKKMQEKGGMVDSFTCTFLIKVCGQLGSDILSKQMHCSCLKHGLDSHVFVRNTLIHMYDMFRDIQNVVQLFVEMPSPDLVSWNTILDSHVYCEKHKEAVHQFLTMLKSGTQPDDAIFVVILSACSALGALDFRRWVHSYVNKTRFGDVISVSNSLVHMYAKCGALEEAYETFNNMKRKNLISWNTMILALATHGNVDEALSLFSKMLEVERPNNVTFVGVLSACSHGRLVSEGRRYFDIMSRDYNIEPSIKHYGCMVDILGRAGLLEEAYQSITSMPMECNAIIWRTLLVACQIHGDMKLGEEVRKHLLHLEPNHSSDYVLLANMYASAEQWNEVISVRNSMKDCQVKKPEPGNSFIGASSSDQI
ncbi:pentatricopeptide repeat-containing protein At1g59720, chloroplastic/mitochondrial-like [Humulus lupulus]|uniref:pentatricopeptide repeat-containing protein At1g59720, chloroplastic/mitochondrial-like n=1 Tax=Humulus lupulus TaxID=3486 RepID=UPI002B4129B3|nr:pentatricopeptide repeat-containing protein At1g59720, chloroplastic/mitochondrial-like [Humulus lupulus]XP_062116574.1 pentatricopeptide repeat-containing protein At1g59720, chloroplastic/mitochondrial-like [Humulus lupulus]